MNLGDKILKLRKQKGLSQEQLGEKVDVTRQTISNWELGVTAPNPEQLKLLSEELNISIDELLENKITGSDKQINAEPNKSVFYLVIKYIGMFFCDIFVSAGFIVLYALLLIMILFSIAALLVALCFIFKFNIANLIPFMPYWCGLITAITLILLSAVFIFGSILYSSFLKKIVRSYINIHSQIMNNKAKKEVSNINNKNEPKDKITLVYMKLVFIGFVLSFILSLIVCMISAESFAFWHVWNWWVY